MPFFDDSGPRPEEERGPIGRSFALVKDQLERLIAVNLLWAAACVPLILAWALTWPDVVRLALVLITAVLLAPATALLFGLAAALSDGLPLDGALVRERLSQCWRPGFFNLLPLYSLFYWLGLISTYSGDAGLFVVDVLARLALLLLAVAAQYWGPLSIAAPGANMLGVVRGSVALALRAPGRTLLTAAVCALALLLGAVSIAGLLLIVPVLVAVLQTQLHRSIAADDRSGAKPGI